MISMAVEAMNFASIGYNSWCKHTSEEPISGFADETKSWGDYEFC